MNTKQKRVLTYGITIIVLSMIIWLLYGGEILTKSQVLVEQKDELFGTTYQEWVDKFVWGLDLSMLISGLTIVVVGFLLIKLKNKQQK